MAKPVRQSEVLASSLVNSVTQAVEKLLDLWNELGFSHELQRERMQAAKAHIEGLLNEMIEEEMNMKEKIENDIKIHRNQLNLLRKELKLDLYKVDGSLTILQLEKDLRLALESALKEKHERVKKLKQLQKEDQGLCTELYETPYYIPTGTVPSILELEELEEHVEKLSKIKEQRLEIFLKLRREVRQYNKEIGHIPDGTLESEMLAVEEHICLSKKNLEDLQLLLHQLQVKKESLIQTKESLMKEVQILWDRLQWPQEQRDQLTRATNNCTISEAIKMWEEELQSLIELKKEQLKEITLKVRHELQSYWQKCYFGDEQKAAFQPFYNDVFSEELLNQHDEELMKMKSFYEKNKYLYDNVHKWETVWNQFMELEKKSTDPSRLLNRGGNLLKDERARVKIQKQLLKLEEELKKSIENWEKETGSYFLVHNQRFLDSMAHQLQNHKVKKDQAKLPSKIDEFSTPKTTVKRTAGVNIVTPSKIRKVASNLTVLKAASCSNISSNAAITGKQRVQPKGKVIVQHECSRLRNALQNHTSRFPVPITIRRVQGRQIYQPA
ncbi:hypothetical protein JRQ81_013226 [Phrynocephalus forsythii]|uniref:Protein regulator of cytokinesis 1 n=1 Tax=Phrynocephalus forsythii TaxID=171643 RepID=A0A9Q0XYT6_9SAUR|nr:hypothetical protein JRQ81_013226 [Phrynocephalus forsythii]